MAQKTLTVLGSTGSIGQNTLDVAGRFPDRFRVHALAAHSNVEILASQIEVFRPRVVALFDPEAAGRLRDLLPRGRAPSILTGIDGLIEAAVAPEVDQVVSGIVGAVGLRPTFAAIEAGKQVALANKETLVLAGELMVGLAAETGSTLLPMDSEHNAIFQCLHEHERGELERIVLTASGGPFRDLPLQDFGEITRAQALAHPNWKMG
ncbi:MAG: 1-deoxy-D-xylulose-5-phosphate reductoisomerase, partial [bacterium]